MPPKKKEPKEKKAKRRRTNVDEWDEEEYNSASGEDGVPMSWEEFLEMKAYVEKMVEQNGRALAEVQDIINHVWNHDLMQKIKYEFPSQEEVEAGKKEAGQEEEEKQKKKR